MLRTFAVAAFALLGSLAAAEDKKPAVPSGTWTHEAGGFELEFAFGKDLTMTLMNGGNGVVVTSSYTTDKEGTVKMKVTKVEEKGSFPGKPPVGMEASFKWKAEGKKATVSDLAGSGTEEAKGIVEGEYTPKK